MDLRDGFRIDEPSAFVRWQTSEEDLQVLFGEALRHVTKGY
jgi:hypothetical protein